MGFRHGFFPPDLQVSPQKFFEKVPVQQIFRSSLSQVYFVSRFFWHFPKIVRHNKVPSIRKFLTQFAYAFFLLGGVCSWMAYWAAPFLSVVSEARSTFLAPQLASVTTGTTTTTASKVRLWMSFLNLGLFEEGGWLNNGEFI